jgi:hypothetical protein
VEREAAYRHYSYGAQRHGAHAERATFAGETDQ